MTDGHAGMKLASGVGRPPKVTDARKFDPPAPWASFYIRLMGPGSQVRQLKHISSTTDDELAWILRVAVVEAQRRKGKNR